MLVILYKKSTDSYFGAVHAFMFQYKSLYDVLRMFVSGYLT